MGETCCQNTTLLTGNARIVFHFAVQPAESQSLWLPGKTPSLLKHFLLVTIYKFRTSTFCNKANSSCTLPVKDTAWQSLLSACSQSFSFTVSLSSQTGDNSVNWWQRAFERISFTHANPIAPLTNSLWLHPSRAMEKPFGRRDQNQSKT